MWRGQKVLSHKGEKIINNIEELKNRSWFIDEENKIWDNEVLESVSNILGIGEDTLKNLVEFMFVNMTIWYNPFLFLWGYKMVKKEYEEA